MSNQLTGHVCLVTGANTGMGKVTASALAKMGATVILGCRSAERGAAAQKEIIAATGNPNVSVLPLDLSSLASVRAAAKQVQSQHPKLDVLVNNAGAWWLDRQDSVDGIELQWATNVLGPLEFTKQLLPLLEKSGHGRIVNVASTAAGGLKLEEVGWTGKYSGASVYSICKQANRMLTWALARRLKGRPITAVAMSPGLVNTELNRSAKGGFAVVFKVLRLFARTPEKGADTIIYLAADPSVAAVTDQFYVDRKSVPCKFRSPEEEEKLWALCEKQAAGK